MKKIIKKLKNRFDTKFTKKIPIIIEKEKNSELENRNAIITGGSSGIGFGVAEAFVKAGANVIITGRNENKLQECCELLNKQKKGRALYYIFDNSRSNHFSSMIEECTNLVNGHISILVNNAGINGELSFPNITIQEYDDIMNTNLRGPFFLSQAFAKYMIEKKINGNILNICSSSGYRPATTAYMLSKWGIRAITEGMAKQLIGYGIIVNGIAPGPTATPMLTDNVNVLNEPNNPSGRYVTVQEIASMAVKLTSSSGRMIVGEIVRVTGGAGVITLD